jgi:NAD(P)-dependent dehydrogenase (short-subunit alcohol dehydrogenase family)
MSKVKQEQAMDLKGRHALVTGGSRGIGRAIAAALTNEGVVVTVLARNEAALADVLREGGARRAMIADVTNAAALHAAVEAAADPFDILVANAGAAESAPFHRSDEQLFRRMIDVNLMGAAHAIQAVLAGMTERGFGRIVAIASTAGLKGYPYVSAYCAAKHAVVGLVRALAAETAATGVTVNAVCPGFTDTDLVARSVDSIMAKTGRERDDVLRELTKRNPQRRLIEPAEVANAVLWLCSDGARAITGQAIAVAGGEI